MNNKFVIAIILIVAIAAIFVSTGTAGFSVKGSAGKSRCFDSDGGIIDLRAGTVTIGKTTYSDACSNSAILIEYSCSSTGTLVKTEIQCTAGCINNVCKCDSTLHKCASG